MKHNFVTTSEFLILLDGVKPSGGGKYMALCPAHDDHEPSLSITEVDGKILLNCFAGCSTEEILRVLGLEMADLFLAKDQEDTRGGGVSAPPETCYPVTPGNDQPSTVTPGQVVNSKGLTLDRLAEAKHIGLDFLKQLGIIDFFLTGNPAVRIPYHDEYGAEVSIRFRLNLTGDNRFRWKSGSKPMLYGLNRLNDIKQAGWVLLVEGESDCWTMWQHGLPALGIPGKATWRSDWASYLKGIKVYLWQEPQAEDLVFRVMKDIPELMVIEAPDGVKDISEAHIQGKDIPVYLEDLKNTAVTGAEIKVRSISNGAAELRNKAKAVLESDDPLQAVEKAIKDLGYGGDIKPALVTYLSATTRLLDSGMLGHLMLMGQPSSGKSYTVSIVKALLPPEACYEISAGSPHALIYDTRPLEHRVLIFSEADSIPTGEENPAASAMRSLLQENHMNYLVTVKNPKTGEYATKVIQKKGPTVLITTSTKTPGYQLASRLFIVEMVESPEQLRASLMAQAALEIEGKKTPPDELIALQSYLQLQAPTKVTVPFSPIIASLLADRHFKPRTNRDFSILMALLKALAILRQHKRAVNGQGEIMATLDDYGTVRELINDVFIGSAEVAENVRKLVYAVAELKRNGCATVNQAKLAEHLKINKMSVSRYAAKAVYEGWLVNEEDKKFHPADYELGDLLPEKVGLPTREEVEERMKRSETISANPVPDFIDGNKVTDSGSLEVAPAPLEEASMEDGERETWDSEYREYLETMSDNDEAIF